MRKGSALDYVLVAGLGLVLLVLVVVLFQVNTLEKRFITQGEQLRALGEASERLMAGGVRVKGGGATASASGDEKFLHPEVENFLQAADTHWPPPGADLDGVLTRGWSSGDPKGFNSLTENAAELSELIEAYATLPIASRNSWTDPSKWHGELAHRVEITDDSKEFTIYLKRGVLWHPPPNLNLEDKKLAWLKGDHEVTAEDVVFSFETIVNPQVENGALKNYYAELESVKAHDSHTVIVRWKKRQYTNIEVTLATPLMPKFLYAYDADGKPFPKETFGLRFNQHWYNNKGFVGAGPYRMESYTPGAKIVMVRNERFIGEKPAIQRFVYPIYTDPQQTLLKLKAHELSTGGLTPGQYREEILKYSEKGQKPAGNPFFDGRIQCQIVDAPVFRYLGWNADRPLFKDKRVRRALTMAFDRQRIIDSVFVGLGAITTGPYVAGAPYADPSIKPYPFDLDAAKKLLAEAGFTDSDGDGLLDKKLRPGDAKRSPFEFTLLLYGSSKEYGALANILREDLLKIGVKMNIDAAEWSLMQKRMEERGFDAYTGAWAMSYDIDLFQIWHSSQANAAKGSNMVAFRNPEADKLIEELRVTLDPKRRTELLQHFHRIVHEEQPYSFFMTQKSVACAWKEVKNLIFAKERPVSNALPWWVRTSSGG